jgi:hypothetical protein
MFCPWTGCIPFRQTENTPQRQHAFVGACSGQTETALQPTSMVLFQIDLTHWLAVAKPGYIVY